MASLSHRLLRFWYLVTNQLLTKARNEFYKCIIYLFLTFHVIICCFFIFTRAYQWSYGVLLWEILTKGGQPYQGLENLDIREYLERGGRLSQPHLASDVM